MLARVAKFVLFQYLVVGTLAAQNATAQTTFEIDNAHTAVIFAISHFKIGYVYGRFNKCSGTVTLDQLNPSSSKFTLSIDAASIDTNDKARDEHLRSTDFFDVKKFPIIEFESTSVVESSGKYSVTGKMKMHGQEKEITIPLQLLGVGKGPFGKVRLGMLGKFTLKRTDFAIDKMLEGIGNDVAVTLSFQAIRK